MNLMFASDFHILESELLEINEIFAELLILKDKYSINKIIIPGDSFDSIKPTSKELDCLSNFFKNLNIPIILIAANSHESTTPEDSVVNHFGLLNEKIYVCKEYIDEERLFVGHFGVKESTLGYGGTVSKTDLRKYKNVVLGHFHNHEIIKPNIMQLGSIRYVDFGEDKNIKKRIAICLNYGETDQKWLILALNSPYSMIDIELTKNSTSITSNDASKTKNIVPTSSGKRNCASFLSISDITAYLDKLDSKIKIRVIFNNYDLWREFLPLSDKYKDKFFLFKEKKDFLISEHSLAKAKNEMTSLKESLKNYLEKNKVEEEIKKIILEEINE
jgi:DNA repair exonuclease SbcCD nuclease subunit